MTIEINGMKMVIGDVEDEVTDQTSEEELSEEECSLGMMLASMKRELIMLGYEQDTKEK